MRAEHSPVGKQGSHQRGATAARGQTAARWAAKLLPVLQELHEGGAVSLDDLAAGLNQRGIPVRGGGYWSAEQVASVLRALGPEVIGKKHG